MIGEMIRSLCPCAANALCGVETRMNVRSLRLAARKLLGQGCSDLWMYAREEEAQCRGCEDARPAVLFSEVAPPACGQRGQGAHDGGHHRLNARGARLDCRVVEAALGGFSAGVRVVGGAADIVYENDAIWSRRRSCCDVGCVQGMVVQVRTGGVQ